MASDSSAKESSDIVDFYTEKESKRPISRVLWRWFRYFLIVVCIAAAFMGPVIAYRTADTFDGLDDVVARQYQNLLFFTFLWLLVSWLGAVLFDLFAIALPYIFRFVIRYLNPAWHRYWRLLIPMRKPITILGATVVIWVSFAFIIYDNDQIDNFVYVNDDNTTDVPNSTLVYDNFTVIGNNIFLNIALWAVLYFVEKIIMMYIRIHYHYRTNLNRIKHSKDMHNALITLYEASIFLNPRDSGVFDKEDEIIRNASGVTDSSSRRQASKYFSRIGVDSYEMTHYFGNFIGSDSSSRWLKPASGYAMVERALASPRSATALARRIWLSIVENGKQAMTAEDVAEVLGPYKRQEALDCFKIIDENESGDIRLDEMILTLIETGRIRGDIYQSMHDIDHCLNTFDWVAILVISLVMVAFILTSYIDLIKQMQQAMSFVVVGLAFAAGRVLHHYLIGSIFLFFDHPFDVGDRIEVFNPAGTVSTPCIVKTQSLLYTVFKRADNWSDMQISNEELIKRRIENLSRSGQNRHALSIMIDMKTTFKDLQYLRSELESFLGNPDNRREYAPKIVMNVVNIHELNKMELKMIVTHKSNWSNDALKNARNNRFMCHLVSVIRKIPLYRPNGMLGFQGDEGRPMYMVSIDDKEAKTKVSTHKHKQENARHDSEKAKENAEKPEDEVKKAENAAKTNLSTIVRPSKPTPTLPSGVTTITSELDGEEVAVPATGTRIKHQGASALYNP